MAQEIEIEFKNLLTKTEYDRILHAFPFPEQGTVQTNYYFETRDFSLLKNSCALRIREKNVHYQLTLKEPAEIGLLETHDSLTEKEAQDWINGKVVPKMNTSKRLKMKKIAPEDLIYFGKLKTLRRELKRDGLTFVLDYSTYHNEHDYELEIEAPEVEKGKIAMETLLEELDIEKKATPNKIARFFMTHPSQPKLQ